MLMIFYQINWIYPANFYKALRLYYFAKIEKFRSDYCGQKVKINQSINKFS